MNIFPGFGSSPPAPPPLPPPPPPPPERTDPAIENAKRDLKASVARRRGRSGSMAGERSIGIKQPGLGGRSGSVREGGKSTGINQPDLGGRLGSIGGRESCWNQAAESGRALWINGGAGNLLESNSRVSEGALHQ